MILFLAMIFNPCLASPQNSSGAETYPVNEKNTAEKQLPRSFYGIELGMSMDNVKEVLKSGGLFNYRGDPDVSLLPRPNESLIEVSGTSYIKRAFFQFYEDQLFIIILAMNEKEIDHYSLFMNLSGKYGKPELISPAESQWNDGETRISIERPLTVKYVDMVIFNELKVKKEELRSIEDILRSNFLDHF